MAANASKQTPCCTNFVVGLDNADNLKELYSRAQGEVSIREALRELEMWGAAATFTLTGYSDSTGKELTIIKDWKELVNQVREGGSQSLEQQCSLLIL